METDTKKKFDWVRDHVLEFGDSWELETHLGTIQINFREGHNDGILSYSRSLPDSDEPECENTLILEKLHRSRDVQLDLLPIYPDRPIVFHLDEPLTIPPDNRGFFFLTFYLQIGVTVQQTETVIESIYPGDRKKSYWGPPQEGISVYAERSTIYTDPLEIMNTTSTAVAVVPVYYHNDREEGENVEQCLVPLRELDLYKNDSGDLIFEVIRLRQLEDFYQEPRPLKRAPNEIQEKVTKFLESPEQSRTLFESVRSLPRLDQLSHVFLNR